MEEENRKPTRIGFGRGSMRDESCSVAALSLSLSARIYEKKYETSRCGRIC